MTRLFDLKYAFRLLMQRPGFSLLAITALAVATALSLVMLGLIHTMVYKALPFEDGEDIVIIDGEQDGIMLNGGHLSPLDLEAIRLAVSGLEELTVLQDRYANVSGRDSARAYLASRAAAEMFHLTRTEPILGRVFTADEVRSGGEAVVVISHDVWQNYFGGVASVIDRMIGIDGQSTRVIGVMPPGYRFPYTNDLWLPLRLDTNQVTRGDGVKAMAVARLAKGVSVEQVRQEVRLVMRRLASAYPETNERLSAFVTSLPRSSMGQGMWFVVASWVTAILLVVLAAVNVGNLLLSRALERSRETAIRLALGAPLARLIMQMMWESALIIFAGAGIGLLLAAWGLDTTHNLAANFLDEPPLFWWNFGVDGFILSSLAWMVLGMLVISGLFPAVHAASTDFNTTLRDGARVSVSRKDGRISSWLVVVECLVSVTILIIAAVLVITTYLAVRADYGVNATGFFTARVNLPDHRYREDAERSRFVEDLRDTLNGKGGVRDVAIMSSIPGTGAWRPTYEVEGFEYRDSGQLPRGVISSVVPGSMTALGMELLEGRYFDSRDTARGMDVVIVSEATARRHWPAESALGQRIRVADNDLPDGYTNRGAWHTVIGVVGQTVHDQPLGEGAFNTTILYVPFEQQPNAQFYVAFAYPGDLAGATRTLGAALNAIDEEVPAFSVLAYPDRLFRNIAAMAFLSQLFLLFGLVAVLLAGSGIYGVTSNAITQRTQEIGVKRALGATDGRVFRDFFSTAGKRLSFGIVPGTLLGGFVALAMANLFDLDRLLVISIVIAMPLLLSAVIVVATWVPTRRALLLEPGDALRHL